MVQPASWARLRTSSSRVSSLSRSYGEALMDSSSPASAERAMRHAAAVLPEVLADGEGHVDAVHAHDRHGVAGHEVAELVEDAVVRQVVLGVGQDDLAAVQHRSRVAGRAGRLAELRLRGLGPVEVADDHRKFPEALLGEPCGELAQGRAGRLHEGRAQGEVLDGIPGQRHLRERHQVRSLLGGVPGPAEDRLGVPGEVTDA